MVRNMCRISYRTKIDGVKLGQSFHGPLGHHGAVLAVVIATPGEGFILEVQPRDNLLHSPQRFQALWHDFLADAITEDNCNMVSGHGLSSSARACMRA